MAWRMGLGWVSDKEPEVFRDFRDRLSAASAQEEATLAALQARANAEGERQLQQQYGEAIGLGYGAAQGGGTAALRGAAYGAGSMRQQQSSDLAMMRAVQDQAFRQQHLDLLGRRGGYELGAQGLSTKGYGLSQQKRGDAAEREAADAAQEHQQQASNVGLGVGAAGAAAGGAMRMSDRSYKEGIEEGRRQVEDATLAALRRRDEEVETERRGRLVTTLAGPKGSLKRKLFEATRAVLPEAEQQVATEAARAAAPRARSYRRVEGALPVAEAAPPVTMTRPGVAPAGTYGWDPRRREFTPDVPDAVELPPMEVRSDRSYKQNVRPARGQMTADEIGLALDVEDARMGQRLRAQGPVRAHPPAAMRPEDFDRALEASSGHTYRYTDAARDAFPDATDSGEQYGPMADALRQTRVGRAMLSEDGKALDVPRTAAGAVALAGRLDERLSAVESALAEADEETRRKLRAGGAVRTEGY